MPTWASWSIRGASASSPVIYGDRVIQLCDSASGSSIAAFDKRTGKPAWRTERPTTGSFDGCWTTPLLVTANPPTAPASPASIAPNSSSTAPAASRRAAGWSSPTIPKDGRELWRVRGTTDIVSPTMIAAGDLVYSTSGRNGPILAIRPGGSGDVTETQVAWKLDRGGPYIPTGLAYPRPVVHPLRQRAGHLLPCRATARRSGPIGSAGISAPAWWRRPAAFTPPRRSGTVYVFADADEFSLLAENDLDEPMLATPAMASGELFLRTEGHLYCVPAEDNDGGRG